MGRIPKPPNPIQDQVESLAAINCTWEEISQVIGIPERTAKRKYGANYTKGKFRGRSNLKKRMYEIASGGNVVMLIWLSKQMFGYTDKVEQKQQVNMNHKEIVEIQWADERTQADDSKDAVPDAPPKKNQPIQ